jgi:hypothetical protein
MKHHLLQKAIVDFIESQFESDTVDWYLPHSIVSRFHAEWQHLADLGLKETYDQCLRSEISNRWWKKDNKDAKEIMLQLIDADPELAAIAWKDLQQPQANLEGRLSRFNYYCEQLLDIYRSRHINSIETYHHQDASMLSLYLAGLFPETYSLYPGLVAFQSFCKAVGSPDIPKVDDLVRYRKVVTIIFNFLEKNDRFDALLQWRTPPMHMVPCIPFQITYEVVNYTASVFQAQSK